MARKRVAIVGIADLPVGRYPDYTENELAMMVIKSALEDAGISKREVEGFFAGPNGAISDMLFSAAIAESLRIEPKSMAEIACGATGGALAIKHAMNEIILGHLGLAVCFASEKELSVSTEEWNKSMEKSFGEDLPFGPTVFGYYALVAQRYLWEYGATSEHLAMVAVKNRENASKNPNAMFREPITVTDVLNSRMIASPLHLLDCAPRADGAAALVLASADRARKVKKPPIFIAGLGEQHDSSNFMIEKKPLTSFFAAPIAAERAFKMAGKRPEDINLVEIYEPFSVCEIILSEDLGFFEKGKGYEALERGETKINGRIPINTSGGRLSLGHPAFCTSLLMHTHAVRQLRGEADELQVKGAKTALIQCEHGMNNGMVVTILEGG